MTKSRAILTSIAVLGAAWAESGRIHFREAGRQRGVVADVHCGDAARRWIPEANGSGAAWLDYDNDGWVDLLVVNGADMGTLRLAAAGRVPPARKGSVYLFHNTGNGQFEDVTARAGLSDVYWGTGANAADFDNDGYTDVLITNIGVDLLYRNNHDGTFTEIGRTAGLSRKPAWHTGSAFGDYDGDGNPDLYVAGYVSLSALRWNASPPVCRYRGLPGFCGPIGLKGEPDILYHNNGNGTFTDVTAQAGVSDKDLRHGFSVLFDDLNGDGRPDIFVANDSDPNYLYLNRGDGTFREAGLSSGVAFSGDGQAQSNMGIAAGDYDNDGRIDLLTTTFSEDYFPLFRQTQPGYYEDVSRPSGLAAVTLPWVGWACGFTDFDNDGWKDLWFADGHVYPNAGALPTTRYRQPFVVMRNAGGRFARQPAIAESVPDDSYRGGATADFNNDGRMDLVLLPVEGPALLLENDSPIRNRWIGFQLRGRSNRDALGASVRVEGCGKFQVDTVRNGGSYLSRNDPRLHFGLGACGSVDRIVVRWPNGSVQKITSPKVDTYVILQEPPFRN